MESIRRRVVRAFWFVLATLFLIESWLWDHVKEWLRWLARRLGAERLEAFIVSFVEPLSPPATLIVFTVPVLLILPLKIYAVDLIATGHVGYGLTVILTAKTLGLGVTAFLFDLCRDKLLRMRWFAKFYDLVLRVRAWAHALVAPVRERLVALRAALRLRLGPFLAFGRSQFARRVELVRALVRRKESA